jgi:hypothetical protein
MQKLHRLRCKSCIACDAEGGAEAPLRPRPDGPMDLQGRAVEEEGRELGRGLVLDRRDFLKGVESGR